MFTIAGVDVLVLLLLLHGWLIVVGIAAYADDASSGVRWVDRRVSLSVRLYATFMLAATVVVWLPFALGEYPLRQEAVSWGDYAVSVRRSRTIVLIASVAAVCVGAGFYCLGGLATTLRLYVGFRRAGPSHLESAENVPLGFAAAVETGDEERLERYFWTTIVGCAVVAVTLIGFGGWMLLVLGGHG